MPNVELTVKGRLKELWKPILQITSDLPIYSDLYRFVEDQRKARLSDRQDTLESKIVKVVELATRLKLILRLKFILCL